MEGLFWETEAKGGDNAQHVILLDVVMISDGGGGDERPNRHPAEQAGHVQ